MNATSSESGIETPETTVPLIRWALLGVFQETARPRWPRRHHPRTEEISLALVGAGARNRAESPSSLPARNDLLKPQRFNNSPATLVPESTVLGRASTSLSPATFSRTFPPRAIQLGHKLSELRSRREGTGSASRRHQECRLNASPSSAQASSPRTAPSVNQLIAEEACGRRSSTLRLWSYVAGPTRIPPQHDVPWLRTHDDEFSAESESAFRTYQRIQACPYPRHNALPSRSLSSVRT